ncbi:MAG: CBS and ACT domain-containing protein [Candidatus Bipolaricaulia bacterium]
MFIEMWMTRDVVTVSPEAPIMDARETMRQHNIRRLPVMKGEKLVGIVTQGDIQEAGPSDATSLSIWELNYLLAKTTVEEVMSREVVTVRPQDTIEEAAVKMRRHKVGGLPVVGGQEGLVGIITESDIFVVLIEVMGFEEGGTRLTIELKDEPGALVQVLEPIRDHHVNILSLASSHLHPGPPNRREVVIRMVAQGNTEEIIWELKAADIQIVDVR